MNRSVFSSVFSSVDLPLLGMPRIVSCRISLSRSFSSYVAERLRSYHVHVRANGERLAVVRLLGALQLLVLLPVRLLAEVQQAAERTQQVEHVEETVAVLRRHAHRVAEAQLEGVVLQLLPQGTLAVGVSLGEDALGLRRGQGTQLPC